MQTIEPASTTEPTAQEHGNAVLRATRDGERRSLFLSQMRRVPGTIAVIATAVGGERTGLAATAWTSLCADPPMLLACVNRTAGSHALIARGQRFSVNVLPASEVETVAIFSARRGLNGKDRFLLDKWEDGPLGQPLLRGAVASFECLLKDRHEHGTHTVLVGEVGEIRGTDSVQPLLYLDGRYAEAVRSG